MSDESEVTLYPAWKQAVADFLAAGFKPGDLIPHAWLAEHFGMPTLAESARLTVTEFQDRQFEWLSNVESLKQELLEGHQIYLSSVHGQGWRWVPPHEQTKTAMKKFEREAGKAFRQAGSRLTNLQVDALDDKQRRENVDAIAKLSMLRGMHRQKQIG